MRQDKRVIVTRLIEGDTPNFRIFAELVARKIIEGESKNGRKEV